MEHSYLCCLCLLAVSKYFRLFVNCIAFWSYRPILVSDNPQFTPKNVTVVIPCLDGDSKNLRDTIRSIIRNGPLEIILVTIDANLEKAERMAVEFLPYRILVLSIPKANKRHQMCRALPYVTTQITIFADDDVIWPSTCLQWMLEPFKDDEMGGVGTNQRLRREKQPNIWNFFGAAYLIRRNWDCTACSWIDGGLPCLSGRTVAYRTRILQDPEFQHYFTHETWRSCQLNADDDNFLTRWMVNHGWKTWIQYHKECEVVTTLEDNSKYLKQCERWARSNWRSNLTTLFSERTVWRRHLWSTFAVFQTTLTNWAFPADVLMLLLFWLVTNDWHPQTRKIAMALWSIWVVLLCRLLKYVKHFITYPEDLKYILLLPLFGYYHSGWIKVWAMVTMSDTTWGSREGADANNDYRMIRLPGYGNDSDANNRRMECVSEFDDQFPGVDTALLPEYRVHVAKYDSMEGL